MEIKKESINEIHNNMEIPNPQRYRDFYVHIMCCPICLKKVSKKDMNHPNDLNHQLKIHKECWEFIKTHWKCRGCGLYFSEEKNLKFHIIEHGSICKKCYKNLKKKNKKP